MSSEYIPPIVRDASQIPDGPNVLVTHTDRAQLAAFIKNLQAATAAFLLGEKPNALPARK